MIAEIKTDALDVVLGRPPLNRIAEILKLKLRARLFLHGLAHDEVVFADTRVINGQKSALLLKTPRQ